MHEGVQQQAGKGAVADRPGAALRWAWVWAVVAGPLCGVLLAAADAAISAFGPQDTYPIPALAAASLLALGLAAFVTSHAARSLGVGVAAGAFASLVAAALDAAVALVEFVHLISQPGSRPGEGGMAGAMLILFVVALPAAWLTFRLLLSVTLCLLPAWLGAYLGRRRAQTAGRHPPN